MTVSKSFFLILFTLTAISLTGCTDLTNRGPAPLDKTVDPQGVSDHPRVGYVYCMRGWLGIFSEGMDALADKIDTQTGVPAVSVADEEWRRLDTWLLDEYKAGHLNGGPLVLLGHSYGADDMIRVANDLGAQGITVDLLVLLDPVTPSPVNPTVKRVYCIYKSHPVTDWYPAWRGVPATVADPATPLVNINLRFDDVGWDTTAVGHANIEKSADVHEMVMREIEKTCPLRTEWARLQSLPHSPTVAVPAPAPPVTARKDIINTGHAH